jgi:hypothetical protein
MADQFVTNGLKLCIFYISFYNLAAVFCLDMSKAPEYPLLWIMTEYHSQEIPFGEVVVLKSQLDMAQR